jgi:hypothetical protein
MTTPTTEDMSDYHPTAKRFAFLGSEKTKRAFIWVPLIGFLLTSLLGIIYPQKYPAPWEKIGDFAVPASWAIFGLVMFAVVALLTPLLAKIFVKAEGYYPGESLPDAAETEIEGEGA